MQSRGHQRGLTHEMKTLAILIWVKPPSLADDDPGCGAGLCSTAPCLEPSWRSTKCHLIMCDPKSVGAALPLPLQTQPLQPRGTGGCRKRRGRADARLPPAFSVSSESPLPAARGHFANLNNSAASHWALFLPLSPKHGCSLLSSIPQSIPHTGLLAATEEYSCKEQNSI